jgi:hypothetical protein
MTGPVVSRVRYTPACPADAARGLLGFVVLVLDGVIELRGLALRRTSNGEIRLSFPERIDRRARRHPLVKPTTLAARAAIERAVLDALRINQRYGVSRAIEPANQEHGSPSKPGGQRR